MAGIAVGWFCDIDMSHVVVSALPAVAFMLYGLHRDSKRWLFGFSAMAVMFLLGIFVEHCQSWKMKPEWSGEKLRYSARLLEVPAVRGTNVKVLAHVAASDTLLPQGVRNCGNVYLYFPRTVESGDLCIGDSVFFEAVVQRPCNAGNPAEFDIESFYYIEGITGTLFLQEGEWTHKGHNVLTLQEMALSLREKLISRYASAGFCGDELSLLKALTLGEKRDFPQELKESYSAAGASHVLALSGLHLGIFYMLVLALLPNVRGRAWLVVREAVVVLLLWGFAFVAGLSPSVVRAALLFTLISVGRCIGQGGSSLNSLSFAAMAMLLFSPHLLFDVSFQLSFAAVAAILLLAPPMQRLFKTDEHGAVYRYVINLFILSVAAQVGTLPFVWYYFGVFPLYFMLTNLLVVPLAFVVIMLAVLFLASSPFPAISDSVAWVLGKAVAFMNWAVCYAAELPGASLEMPPLGLFGAFCVTVLLTALCASVVMRRWGVAAIFAGCALLPALSCFVYDEQLPKRAYMLVYNNRKNPLVHAVAEDGRSYLVSTVPEMDAEYEYVSAPYVRRERLMQPQWAVSGYADSLLVNFDGILSFAGLEVRMVDNDLWRENIYSCPADAVLLCRGFRGSIKELMEVYPTACLLLDGSLYKHSRKRILRECAALGIDAVDVSATGAVKLLPGNDSFELIPARDVVR